MTTSTTQTAPAEVEPLQARVSDNVRYLIGKRRTSGRQVAIALGLSSSGITNRLNGKVEWNTGEIEAVARVLHVPWTWLLLTEAELVTKCTAPDLNRQPADSLHTVVFRGSTGVTPRTSTSSSPRGVGRPLALVRPWSSATSSSAPRALRPAS